MPCKEPALGLLGGKDAPHCLCRDFEFADFPTLGQVLQHYPRDYRHYHSVLSEGALVEVPARVLSIWVQPMRMRGGWLKAEVEVWQEQPPPGGSSTYR